MPEIKQLVLDDKWHATVGGRIEREVNALTVAFVERIRELGERYAETSRRLQALLGQLETRLPPTLPKWGSDDIVRGRQIIVAVVLHLVRVVGFSCAYRRSVSVRYRQLRRVRSAPP